MTCSGTVTAAMEAVIWSIPGIAFSLNNPDNHLTLLNYDTASIMAEQVVNRAITAGIPQGILLNVNIPYLPAEQIQGFRATRQGLRVYQDRIDTRTDPRGKPYYWIGGEAPAGIPEDGTDVGALADGYVSITPLQLDLTAYPVLQKIQQWKMETTLVTAR